MSRNKHPRSKTTLRFESLEKRRLLAVAAFETEILQDDAGIPGEVIVGNTLEAGESFFLRVTAREFDPSYRGIGSAAVDVNWDSGLIEVIEEAFSPERVVTENLPVIQTGVLDQSSGSISHLGGSVMLSSQLGAPIGDLSAETLALIPMRAGTRPGMATIQLSASRMPTVLVPFTELATGHLRFGSESITIVEPSGAEPLIDTPGSPVEMETASAVGAAIPEEVVSVVATRTTPNPEILTVVSDQTTSSDVEINVDSTPVVLDSPSHQSSSASPDAAVDQVMSFDMNQDGLFDFADFGLMNLSAVAVPPISEPVPETTQVDQAEDDAVRTSEPQSPPSVFPHTCLAFPNANDIAANEAWMDALATAWLADADAREKRRKEAEIA